MVYRWIELISETVHHCPSLPSQLRTNSDQQLVKMTMFLLFMDMICQALGRPAHGQPELASAMAMSDFQ